MDDTIAAISTSLGIGAISIIRVSGNESIDIVNKIFKGKNLKEVESHTINYGHIIDNDLMIDEVLVSVMRSPKTFTKEDIVEINCHGGIATTKKVLELLLNNGCRLAEPGEFTKRAFLNGRIDLVEAEGIMDLIESKSEKSRQLAINQVDGKVSNLIKNLRKEIEELDKIKNSYIIDNNISKAYEYRKQETELMSKLNELELGNKVDSNYKEVSKEDIAKVINVRTHIPVYEIMQDKIKVIKKIESDLSEIVVGQNKATSKLINITKRIKLGYFDHKCYSMLMVGPTGVGKSLIAKTYGELLVGRDNVIRLDMSEYSDATSVNKIVGSAPGYVGYDDNKNILEEIRNKPNAVILLDEIEKAHPKVINLFYQILDEGRIKDSKGNVIRLDNNIILMTSNVGFERNLVGFNEMKEDNVLSSLKKEFSVSFINRVDDIVTFNRLELDDIKLIIEKKLDLVKKKYNDLEISFEGEVINSIVDKANYKEFGARQIDKIITKDIENIIIDGIINGKKKMVITNDMLSMSKN